MQSTLVNLIHLSNCKWTLAGGVQDGMCVITLVYNMIDCMSSLLSATIYWQYVLGQMEQAERRKKDHNWFKSFLKQHLSFKQPSSLFFQFKQQKIWAKLGDECH